MNKLKLPKSVKIGAKVYKVSETPGLFDGSAGHRDLQGEISYNNATIKIARVGDHQNQTNTLLHECFHGIFNHLNVNFSDYEKEESLTLRLTEGLLMLFRDNPEILKMIASTHGSKRK